MGVIWVKCPATGRQASTGIETDAKGFADFPDKLNNVRCPACGMRHSWLKEDAWFAEPSRELELLRKAG
jgi:endogenous inhibitor of DNA gyrase (YacG/DUF329 family)